MSGPKAYNYKVINQIELQRRENAARLIRCTKLMSRIKELFEVAIQLGISHELPRPIERQTIYSAEDERLLIQTESEIKSCIDDENRRLRICGLKTELSEIIRSSKYLAAELTENDYIAAAKNAMGSLNDESVLMQAILLASQDAKNAEAKSVASSAAKSYGQTTQHFSFQVFPIRQASKDKDPVLAELLPPVTDAISQVRDSSNRQIARERLECIANLSDQSAAEGELFSLKNWLHSILEAEGWAELAAKEILQIEHVESELADQARLMSENVSSRSSYNELKSAVSEALAEYSKAEDEKYVQAALREALEALGFTIGEEFSTTDFGKVGVALHSSVPGYGIRIQNNPKSAQILTRVVSYSESNPDQDTRAEQDTCPMVHSLADKLENHGIEMDLVSERMPGECPTSLLSKRRVGQNNTRAQKAGHTRERMM
ncbi:Uncharacterised protein [Slackia heliotrinireducens]|nr:Uncharacterised protein [Slackia heliotrinireducens]